MGSPSTPAAAAPPAAATATTTTNESFQNDTTSNSSSSSSANMMFQQPLLEFTAPLNDIVGPTGTSNATPNPVSFLAAFATATATATSTPPPAARALPATTTMPTTTILPPMKRPASGGGFSDASLLDDLERWCHRQFGTALSSGGGGTKRRRVSADHYQSAMSGGSSSSSLFQMQQQAAQTQAQQPQAQSQAASTALPPPPCHSLTTSPSSLTTRKKLKVTQGASFTDLLQVFDAHELKEAIATGSVFDDYDLAAQSAIESCAPYAADWLGDMAGVGLLLPPHDDDDVFMMGGEELRLPSSMVGSIQHGKDVSGDGSSGCHDLSQAQTTQQPQQPQQGVHPHPPAHAYEMMTSDVHLPAETREELRMAYPPPHARQSHHEQSRSMSVHPPPPLPPRAHHQYYQVPATTKSSQSLPNSSSIGNHHQTFRDQMRPAPVEVTPRPSNVTATTTINTNNTNTAFPTRYNDPQDYYHDRPAPQQDVASSQLRFLESLRFSAQSEQLLREWDRSMGLKACHSKTMLRTGKSRKKVLAELGSVATLLYLKRLSEDAAGQRGSDSPYGSRHGSMVGSYPSYQGNSFGVENMTSATSPCATGQKKEDPSMGTSASHENFQEQIEKNSQTATMA